MEYLTHDGTVRTDEALQAGYVFYLCSTWSVPDNTRGGTGWHVIYRPLSDGIRGHDHLTDAMRRAAEEHYADRDAATVTADSPADSPAVAEWRSPRGLTLAEEMDREDTIY